MVEFVRRRKADVEAVRFFGITEHREENKIPRLFYDQPPWLFESLASGAFRLVGNGMSDGCDIYKLLIDEKVSADSDHIEIDGGWVIRREDGRFLTMTEKEFEAHYEKLERRQP